MANKTQNQKHIRLTADVKNEICRLRLNDTSLIEISKALDMPKQTVYYYFQTLPKLEDYPKYQIPLPVTIEKAYKICSLYNCGASIEQISSITKCKEKDVLSVFSHMTAHKRVSTTERTCYFPKVLEWIQNKGLTFKDLSMMIGEEENEVFFDIYGYKFMSLDVAKKISDVTGLTITDIFSEFADKWLAEEKSET